MFANRTIPAAAALALVFGSMTGCSSSPATASGQVTYDGQPVSDGYITFTPADGKGPAVGGKITDGRYAVEKLTPGPKIVKVIGVKKVSFASTSEEMMRKSAEARKAGNHDGLVDPADTIPETAEGNNAQVEIAPGANTHDFQIRKPPTRK